MASSSQPSNESAKWTKSEVDMYVMLMVEEVKKGNRTTTTFKKAGWNNIMTQFEARTGHRYTMMQFRNKMNKLRIDYSNFKKLLKTPGFSWNSLTRTCTVDNDGIWNRHIKANPHWAKFRKFGLPQWPELQIIFGDTYANGDNEAGHAEDVPNTDNEDVPNTDNEDDQDVDLTSLTTPLDGGLDDTDAGEPAENPQSETHGLDRALCVKKRRRSRSRSRSSDFSMALQAIADLFQARMERINITSTSSLQVVNDEPYSIGKCMDVLSTLTEIEDDVYIKAVKRIMDDPNWREAFMHCPPDRKNLLLRMLD